MSPIRALLLAPLVFALFLMGAVFWLFTTEITPANAQQQVSRLCMTVNAGISIDRMTGLSGMQPQQNNCGCAVQLLERMYSGEKGARLADTMRRLMVNRFRAALSGQRPPVAADDQGSFRDIARYFSGLAGQCAAKPAK
jgi:uncharacterized membrane protein